MNGARLHRMACLLMHLHKYTYLQTLNYHAVQSMLWRFMQVQQTGVHKCLYHCFLVITHCFKLLTVGTTEGVYLHTSHKWEDLQ